MNTMKDSWTPGWCYDLQYTHAYNMYQYYMGPSIRSGKDKIQSSKSEDHLLDIFGDYRHH